MAIQKNFVIKNGLEVDESLIFANSLNNRVGINTSIPLYTLQVNGGIGATSLVLSEGISVSGVLTTGDLEVYGYLSIGGTTGLSGQYLRSTGSGAEWATFPTTRTNFTYIATTNQTVFGYAYNIGFVDVYRNGVKLKGDGVNVFDEFIANNGTTIELIVPCFGGEVIDIVAYNPNSIGSGGTGGSLGLTVQDEGINIGNDNGITSINFVGADIVSAGSGAGVTVYVNQSGYWTPTSAGIHTLSNVGIGTTNPTGALTVIGTVQATSFIGEGSGLTGIVGTGSGVEIQENGSPIGTAATINFGSNLDVSFAGGVATIDATGTGSTSQWVTTSAGIHTLSNVGIGTTNPTSDLTVVGDARVTGILTVGSSSITLNGITNIINVGTGVTLNGSTGSISATSIVLGGSTLTGAGVTSITAGSGISVNSATGNVTITATGSGGSSQFVTTAAGIHTLSNVGIGTTNPTSALTVKGNTSLETLSVSGVSTFAGITTVTGTTLFTKQLNVSGVSTFNSNIRTNGSNIKLGDGNEGIGNQIKLGNGSGSLDSYGDSADLWIYHNASFGKNWIQDITSSGVEVLTGEFKVKDSSNSNTGIIVNSTFGTEIYYSNSKKFETLGAGVTVTGTTFTNQLSVSGIASVGSAITMYASTGIISATTFYGNVVGNITGSITDATNLTGGYANASSLNVSGIATISQGRIQANAASNLRFGNIAAGSGSVRNIAIGDQVLVSLSGGGGRNIGIGELSYYDTTTGQYNIGVGERAGQKVSTGSYNVILGAYDGNSGGLDIRTSSNNVVIADGQGNIRQYINSSGNVGIKTTVVTEALTVAGIVSATSFYGTLNAGQLTGTLPAIDGSALIGVVGSGSGVIIQDDTTPVGTAGTINFGSNLDVSFAGGTATVSGNGLATYANVAGIATYATNAGVSTTSGTATYATTAGVSTTSGTAGYATTAGISSAVSGTININTTGIITATSFSGSGANLTNLPAGQLTGTLPAIDGSALLNVTAAGTGIVVDDDNVNVGSAVTVNFGTGLDVTFSAGIATITASGGSLQSRTTVSGVTTSITNLGIGNTNITGFKSYALMKVGLSTTGWLRLYTDSTSRTNDASRSVGEDPAPGSGVIAEVVTTGITTTQIISPFVMGGNLNNPADTTIYAAIKNLSGSTQSITANLTILQLEA